MLAINMDELKDRIIRPYGYWVVVVSFIFVVYPYVSNEKFSCCAVLIEVLRFIL